MWAKKPKLSSFLMLFSFTVALIMLLLISTLFYFKTRSFIQDKMSHIQSMKVNQIQFDLVRSFDDAFNVMDHLRADERIARYIDVIENATPADAYTRATASADVETLLFNLKKDNPFLGNILIQTERTQYSSDKLYSANLPLREPAGDERKPVQFVRKGQAYPFLGLQPQSVSDTRLRDAMERLGTQPFLWTALEASDGAMRGNAFLLLDEDFFRRQIPYSSHMALLDAEGDPVFVGSEVESADLASLGKLPDGDYGPREQAVRNRTVTVKRLTMYDFTIVYEENVSIHRKQLALILKLLAIMLGSCVLLSFVMSPFVSSAILRPLFRFLLRMKRYETLGDRLAPEEGKRSLSLQARFLIYFAVTILLPIVVFIASFYAQSMRIVGNELRDSYSTVFTNTSHRIELFIDQKSVGLARISYDLFIRRLMTSESPQSAEQITDWIGKNEYMGLARDTISIYDRQNRLLYSNFYPVPSGGETTAQSMKRSMPGLSYELVRERGGSSYIRLGAAIYSTGSQSIGTISLDVNTLFFANLYADFKENNSNAFIVDDNGMIVSHSNPDMIGKQDSGTKEKDEYRFSSKLPHLPWYFVSEFDVSSVRKQTNDLIYDDISIVLGLLLLALLFSFAMSRYLVHPFRKLGSFRMEEAAAGTLPTKPYGIEEVNRLSETYNRMLERIELLVDESLIANHRQLRLEYEKRELQLLALQAQINPHFLYNTLESLVFTVEKQETGRAVDLIHRLSRLFRYMSGHNRTIVPLREEIAYAEVYVELMAQRQEGHVECRWTVDEALLHCGIVKLVLQPLLENVFHHAVLAEEGAINASITIVRDGDNVRIVVADDGQGIAPRLLQDIQRKLQDSGDNGGIGIYNVNKRLRLHYGDGFGLDIDSVEAAGTSVTVTIPYEPIRE